MKPFHSHNFGDPLNISDFVAKSMGSFRSFKNKSDDFDLKWKFFLKS